MKALLRITAYIAITLVAVSVLFAAWFLGSKRGFPDVSTLSAYAPAHEVLLPPQSCLDQLHAVPSSDLRTIIPLLESTDDHIPNQIARNMVFCENGTRDFVLLHYREIRLAMRMRVRFSTRDLQTIFLNRIYLGDHQYGVEQGAQHYFGVTASQLTLAQSALLVGLIRSPDYNSPYRHPDRALNSRNAIIRNYAATHALSDKDLAAAVNTPLGVKPQEQPPTVGATQ